MGLWWCSSVIVKGLQCRGQCGWHNSLAHYKDSCAFKIAWHTQSADNYQKVPFLSLYFTISKCFFKILISKLFIWSLQRNHYAVRFTATIGIRRPVRISFIQIVERACEVNLGPAKYLACLSLTMKDWRQAIRCSFWSSSESVVTNRQQVCADTAHAKSE